MGIVYFGMALILIYQASFLVLWAEVSRVRRTTRSERGLTNSRDFFLGTASLSYLWSGRHRGAADPRLSRVIGVVRATQLGALVGIVLFIFGASG